MADPQMPRAAMLFAAGFGTRMGDLTRTCPKPLIQVAGRALLDHALDLVHDAGPARIVVNTHYLADQIAAHLQGTRIILSQEAPEILDTGGGLRAALPLLGAGPVWTLNTDAIWSGPNPLRLLAKQWDPARMDALLLCVPTAQTIGYAGTGDFRLQDDGRLRRGPGQVYSGAQIVKTDLLHEIAETAFSLNSLWDRMLTRNRLYGLSYPGKWCDVGHPGGIGLAEDMLRNV